MKTTGGAGLHVVTPLVPERPWTECLAFARGLAGAIVRHDPARFTIAYAKAGRERKILLDYLRNNRTNTSVAAFSTRARPGAPVSMPLAWDELARGTARAPHAPHGAAEARAPRRGSLGRLRPRSPLARSQRPRRGRRTG